MSENFSSRDGYFAQAKTTVGDQETHYFVTLKLRSAHRQVHVYERVGEKMTFKMPCAATKVSDTRCHHVEDGPPVQCEFLGRRSRAPYPYTPLPI